jgi:hypothetical protein
VSSEALAQEEALCEVGSEVWPAIHSFNEVWALLLFLYILMHRIAPHYNKEKSMEMTAENQKKILEIIKNPDQAIKYLTKCVDNNTPKAFTFALENIINAYNIDIYNPEKEIRTKHHAICEITRHCICDDEDTEENNRKMEFILDSLVPSQRIQVVIKFKELALSQAILQLMSQVHQIMHQHESFNENNKYTVLR